MNLPPSWTDFLRLNGHDAVHWSDVGDPRATDRTIMAWAAANDYVVFTHDLDFGELLALTHAAGPSVLQVRTPDVLPEHLAPIVIAAVHAHEADLKSGAIVVVDEYRSRVRVLPI